MGICPPSLIAGVFVEYTNFVQLIMGSSVVTVATIDGGETGLQITMIVCNFDPLTATYDLRLKPATSAGALFRGGRSAGLLVRDIQAGGTEFWEFGLRPRELFEVNAGADRAGAIAMTISVSEVFNSGAPEVCPP